MSGTTKPDSPQSISKHTATSQFDLSAAYTAFIQGMKRRLEEERMESFSQEFICEESDEK